MFYFNDLPCIFICLIPVGLITSEFITFLLIGTEETGLVKSYLAKYLSIISGLPPFSELLQSFCGKRQFWLGNTEVVKPQSPLKTPATCCFEVGSLAFHPVKGTSNNSIWNPKAGIFFRYKKINGV